MKKKLLFSLLLVITFCPVKAKTFYFIHVYNGTQTGPDDYTISSGDSLIVKAHKLVSGIGGYIDSTIIVDWYLDNVYQFTAGGAVAFHQPGLISFHGSDNSVQLSVTIGINDIGLAVLPFPFSKATSNVNLNNLRYAVLDLLGNVVDEGTFSGKIILRDAQPQYPLPIGIYFVTYYDLLDNRQVLTDKVFITD